MSARRISASVALVLGLAAGAFPSAAAAAPGVPLGPGLSPFGNPGGTALNAGKQVLDGNVGDAAGALASGAAGGVGGVATASTGLALATISASVASAAKGVLGDAATAVGSTTSPQLRATWFSSTYLRMAAIAAVLTLPFLFAAAVQALIHSDVAMLARAAFGYLPLAMLAIAIAAPLTMLLLAACDELCSFISSAAGNQSAHFLANVALSAAGLTSFGGSPFLAFFIGLFVIVATFALWVELLLREAAVYVIVLMLPLAFAAFVWPARRIWAIRAVELLAALILSKFGIVAVLSLGGAAVSSAGHSVAGVMAGAVLIVLAAFSPWALMRLIPLAELASGAAGSLRSELRSVMPSVDRARGRANTGDEWASRVTAEMARAAQTHTADVPAPPRVPDAAAGAAPEPAAGAALNAASGAPRAASEAASEPAPPAPRGEADLGADAAPGPRSVAENWSEQRVLGLDRENLASTPVWPNEDAE